MATPGRTLAWPAPQLAREDWVAQGTVLWEAVGGDCPAAYVLLLAAREDMSARDAGASGTGGGRGICRGRVLGSRGALIDAGRGASGAQWGHAVDAARPRRSSRATPPQPPVSTASRLTIRPAVLRCMPCAPNGPVRHPGR